MASLNKAMIIGNLGRDPEIRVADSGLKVANFSLATNHHWKDKDGAKQTATEWHRVVTFGRLAEIVEQYLSKGRMVFIEGRLQTRTWEDKEGTTRYTTEIVASNMQMLSGGKSQAGESEPSDTPDDLPF